MTQQQRAPVRFRPERTTLTVVLVMLLGALPLALSSPWLAPALLVPVATAVWVLRARVLAGPGGLQVCNGLGTHRVTWAQVKAFDLPDRGPVRLRTTDGRALRLTALGRRDLRALVELGGPLLTTPVAEDHPA